MAHAVLSASGSSRWLACPPSARLEEKETDVTSTYAEEGSLAHEIGELMIRYNECEFTKRSFNTRLNKLKKNELFANDMLNYCSTYAEMVREKYLEAKKKTPDAQLLIEEKLNFSNVVPDGFGTGDAVIIADDAVEVIDFKYGKGVEVSAIDNSQMKLYGLGALNEYEMLYDIQNLKLTIVQPRIGNLSEYEITADELIAWGDDVKKIAAVAFKGEGDFKAGRHCTFCKIKAKCKAYADEQLKIAKYDFKAGPYLELKEIADIVKKASEFESWLKAVKGYALDQAVNFGERYPGLKLVEGRSKREYADHNKVLETLLAEDYKKEDVHKKPELLGITAMEKLLSKKIFSDLLADLVIKPPGKPTLVLESDKRPEWNSIDGAKKDFEEDILN